MAKKSMIAREVKRRKLNEQHRATRESLRQRVVDESLSYDERQGQVVDRFRANHCPIDRLNNRLR